MSETSGQCSNILSRSADLQRFLESKLVARLAGNGSPEYRLTYTHWDMHPLPSIFAVRASAVHKFDKDTSGLLIAEPTRVGWATPSVRDYKDTPGMSQKRSTGRDRLDQLPRQAFLGKSMTGWSATTENRGALNPALPRWLMGYPKEWDSAAVKVSRRLNSD